MRNLIFIGTNFFSSKILENLLKNKIEIAFVISKSDSKIGRNQKKTNHPVSSIANNFKIPLFKVESINEEKTKSLIKNLFPELIIVAGYGEKIKNDIINIPDYGILNLHPSILPNYKGPMPIQYSILNDELKTGVTIISINDVIDSGEILSFEECEMSNNEDFLSLSNKLIKIGSNCLINLLKNFTKKIIKKKCFSSYTYKFNEEFYKIDWYDSAFNINKKIRAFFGIKKFFSKINLKEFKIIETNVIIYDKINIPGTILNINSDGLDIATGFNVIRIKKIQFPGKKIITIKDLINSNKNLFKIGVKLE